MNIRNYTHYTAYESIIKIPELVNLAKEAGQTAVGIADSCNMYGVNEFYRECKKQEIKPIIGQEFYICDGPEDKRKPRELDRIILYAKNYDGYKNLMLLSTMGHMDNFYYVPRITLQKISENKENIIAVLPNQVKLWLDSRSFNSELLMTKLFKYVEIFENNLYLIVEPNNGNKQVNEWIDDNWIPDNVIISNPNRYLYAEDHDLHDIVYTIQANFTHRNKKSLPSNDFYFMTEDEISEKLSYLKNINKFINNTKKIIDIIDIEIPTEFKFPSYNGMSEDEAFKYMKEIAGIDVYLKIPNDKTEEYIDRFNMECRVVGELGFSNYFLVVADIVNSARRLGVEVGPGRGSVCGSLLAWVLGIHEIDPIENGLYFERFLNPERISMPDIDLDFEDENRYKIIDYVTEKYGEKRVAHICTYSTLGIRGAMKDVARAMGVEFQQSNDYTSVILDKPGIKIEQIKESPSFKGFYEQDPVFRDVFNTAEKLEGLFRQISSHAAAFVIAPDDIVNYTPLQYAKKNEEIVTQFDMYAIEHVGLVKMDFLGLRNMSIVRNTIELVKDQSIRNKMKKFDDDKTYEMLRSGDTVGVFQIDGGGMTDIAIEMGVEKRLDLADLVALYRPAVMQGGLHRTYLSNRRGETNETLHPLLEDTFKDTYGIPLYQESLMRLAGEFANFTYAKADILRKAIGKKKFNLLNSMKNEFIKGASDNGVSIEDSESIWRQAFEGAANYGFNKSHALAYGSIAYYTAFLKQNYPIQFYSSLLTSVQEEQKREKFIKYINDAIKHKIKIYHSDINISTERCIPYSNGLILSLGAIRGIGDNYARLIVEERKRNGKFKDVHDFCRRMNPNSLQLTYLINSRAITGYEEFTDCADEIIKYNKQIIKDLNKNTGGLDIFITVEKFVPPKNRHIYKDKELSELLFEASGLRIEEGFELGQIYTVSTVLKDVKYYTTKKGQQMAYAKMKSYPSYDLVIFPRQYVNFKSLIKAGKKLKIDFTLIKKNRLSLETAVEIG
jgi:DNA polymerase-3 subunit alpha